MEFKLIGHILKVENEYGIVEEYNIHNLYFTEFRNGNFKLGKLPLWESEYYELRRAINEHKNCQKDLALGAQGMIYVDGKNIYLDCQFSPFIKIPIKVNDDEVCIYDETELEPISKDYAIKYTATIRNEPDKVERLGIRIISNKNKWTMEIQEKIINNLDKIVALIPPISGVGANISNIKELYTLNLDGMKRVDLTFAYTKDCPGLYDNTYTATFILPKLSDFKLQITTDPKVAETFEIDDSWCNLIECNEK